MNDASNANVFAAVMAAGSARRFGATKQLAVFDGTPLVERAMTVAAAACGPRHVLVAGHEWRSVSAACAACGGFLIINDGYRDGLGSSIACAARALRHTGAALLVILADQPLVTAGHLRALQARWHDDPEAIVATRFDEVSGPPVLFPPACFDALAALSGDRGARELLDGGRFRVNTVEFAPAAVDIDTPADLGDG